MKKGEKLDRSPFDGSDDPIVVALLQEAEEPRELPWRTVRHPRKVNPIYTEDNAWHTFAVSDKWCSEALKQDNYTAALGIIAVQQYLLWMGEDVDLTEEVRAGGYVRLGQQTFFVETSTALDSGISCVCGNAGGVVPTRFDTECNYLCFVMLHSSDTQDLASILGWVSSSEARMHGTLTKEGWYVPYGILHPFTMYAIHR